MYLIIVCNIISISTLLGHEVHTVGPANNEVPESAIAEQPPEQNPGEHIY